MMVREGHATGGSLTPSTVTATYFQGASGPCYRRDDTAQETDSQGRTVTKARWYVYDGLGSVVGEVDPAGNLTSSPKYDVYGAVRSGGGTATSQQGFVGALGHVSDDTGLIYMRARYYDPSVGRFVSEDPSAHGNNWFAYCSNDPINRVDRDGKIDNNGNLDQGNVTNAVDLLLNLALLEATALIVRGIAMSKAGYARMLEGEQMVLEGESLESGSLMLTGLLTAVSGGASTIAGVSCFAAGLELFMFASCMKIMEEDISEADFDYLHKAMAQQ